MKFIIRVANEGISDRYQENFPIPLKGSTFYMPDGSSMEAVAKRAKQLLRERYSMSEIAGKKFFVQFENSGRFGETVPIGSVQEEWSKR